MEQIENSEGAPPAEQDKIDLLPIVKITQEMVNKGNGCGHSGCGLVVTTSSL